MTLLNKDRYNYCKLEAYTYALSKMPGPTGSKTAAFAQNNIADARIVDAMTHRAVLLAHRRKRG